MGFMHPPMTGSSDPGERSDLRIIILRSPSFRGEDSSSSVKELIEN